MGSLPEAIGPYAIRSVVGAGGMGVVYEGWDPRLDRRVAVKTLRPELSNSDEARRLFLREARAVAAVSHPHVTQIYYIGDEGDMVFFAMEYLDGPSLRDLLQDRGAVSVAEAVNWIRQAALGLKAADDMGLVHRDVKPSNLVLTADGELKVTDFGLAKQVLSEAGSSSQSTTFIATADYVAPERAAGELADRRSDIYSLGGTFFELLTGRPPFQGATPVAVISKHLREPAPSVTSIRPDVPYPITALIQQMLAKQPDARPATYDALIRQLERLAASPIVSGPRPAAPERPTESTAQEPERKGTANWVWIAGVAALLLVGVLGVWSKLSTRGTPASPPLATALPAAAGPVGHTPVEPPPAGRRPTDAPDRNQTATRSELIVVDSDHRFESDGVLRVYGRVRNAGDARATASKIKIIVRDRGDEVAATATIPLDPSFLLPGEEANFDVLIPGVVEASRLQLELRWLS